MKKKEWFELCFQKICLPFPTLKKAEEKLEDLKKGCPSQPFMCKHRKEYWIKQSKKMCIYKITQTKELYVK